MYLSESLMFGSILSKPGENRTLVRMALAGEERQRLAPADALTEFLSLWPWTLEGQLVGPLWSSRRYVLSSPVQHFCEIWSNEVLTGKVRFEKLLDWIRLLETVGQENLVEQE